MLHLVSMMTDELKVIVEAVGTAEVRKALGWSRWTLGRKVDGRSKITKAESFLLQALAVVRKEG